MLGIYDDLLIVCIDIKQLQLPIAVFVYDMNRQAVSWIFARVKEGIVIRDTDLQKPVEVSLNLIR